MLSKLIKFSVGLVLGGVIAVLIAFNVLLVWVATGPRSLATLTPYIQSALQSENGSYGVTIGETWLIWDGWKHPIDIRLKRVSITTREGQVFSNFPELSLGVDVLSLPFGQLLPTSLTITQPIIRLFQNDDKALSLGFRAESADNTEAPMIPAEIIIGPLLSDNDGLLRKLRTVIIDNAKLNVSSATQGVFMTAHDVSIRLRRDMRRGVIALHANAGVVHDEYESKLSAQLLFDRSKPTIDGVLTAEGVMPAKFAGHFTNHALFALLQLPVSGEVNFSVDKEGIFQRAHYNLQGGSGIIHSTRLQRDLSVTALSASGQVSNGGKDVQVDSLLVNIGKITVKGNGVVSLAENDAAIRADLSLESATAGDVARLWPKDLAPLTREWVTTNITEGTVPHASAKLNIALGDLKKPILPKEAVDATIAITGAKIRYLPEHPPVQNTEANILIDGQSLHADVASAEYMKATKISAGQVDIPDLNADNPDIRVSLSAQTDAKDAAAFLALPRLGHADRLNIRATDISGTAELTAKVGFPFFAPRDAKGRPLPDFPIDYDVSAKLTGVSQPGFMKKFDIKTADGALTINNKELVFKGTGEVNGANVSNANVKYLFTPSNGLDTFIDIKASLPVEALPKFGYPKFEFLKGRLSVAAQMKEGTHAQMANAKIDLANAAVIWKKIGLNKPEKEAATLELVFEENEGQSRISSFSLSGKEMDINGSAMLTADLSDIASVSLDKSALGQSQVDKLYFERLDEGGFKLDVRGSSASAEGFINLEDDSSAHFSFQHFPAVQISMDVGKLLLGPGQELSSVKGTLSCSARLCEQANVVGVSGSKPFAFRILRNPAGTRQLSLHAENAGAFLRALDITKSIEGGDLTLTGNYDDSGNSSVLKGRVDINPYTVKRAPILAKILSLASLTGFIDALEGNGIRFNRLLAPFTLANDVITFEKAKTFGPSVGLTMEGTVTMPDITFNMEGTVVPAYSLNTMFGKLPIFGAILTGGEGQGVFAARYNITGTEGEPKVSVNPLSILTPGFLRGLFDIMDAPEENPEKK